MLEWLESELAERRQKSLYRSTMLATHGLPGLIQVDGQWLNNFGANDYLGLASHPRVLAALHPTTTNPLVDETKAINLAPTSPWLSNDHRFGSGASPLVSGYTQDHALLEQALATFEHTEASILFSSGYAANVGTISALASEGDLILSDELNHASLIDGCRLSRAKVIVYPHGNVKASQSKSEHTRVLRNGPSSSQIHCSAWMVISLHLLKLLTSPAITMPSSLSMKLMQQVFWEAWIGYR